VVFDDREKRRKLEEIVHPAIRGEWLDAAEQARRDTKWLVVDIPLLFETQAGRHFDAVVVVAATKSAQLMRMQHDRALDETEASRIIASQMDLGLKIDRADHVIWNNSTLEHLDRQSHLLAELLHKRHG
jgi:dephospho-CoA kinase